MENAADHLKNVVTQNQNIVAMLIFIALMVFALGIFFGTQLDRIIWLLENK